MRTRFALALFQGYVHGGVVVVIKQFVTRYTETLVCLLCKIEKSLLMALQWICEATSLPKGESHVLIYEHLWLHVGTIAMGECLRLGAFTSVRTCT